MAIHRSAPYRQDTADRVWITKPILRTRGWTDAAIRDFLPEPEGYKVNPHYSSATPMPVWSARTVAVAESGPAWRSWLDTSLARRKTTLAALAYPVAGLDDRFDDKLDRAAAAIENALVEGNPRACVAEAQRAGGPG